MRMAHLNTEGNAFSAKFALCHTLHTSCIVYLSNVDTKIEKQSITEQGLFYHIILDLASIFQKNFHFLYMWVIGAVFLPANLELKGVLW